MKKPFREHHILQALCNFENLTLPLDLFLNNYFRTHKAIGANDRRFIAETIYEMIRLRGLLDYFSKTPITWEKRLEIYLGGSFLNVSDNPSIPQHVRLSFPLILFEQILKSHGKEKAIEICRVCNTKAPLTIRANALKTSREALLDMWSAQYAVMPCTRAKHGITFSKRVTLFGLREFKEGLFEVQDEGSQLLADLVQAKPGDLVLDFCAGSGGKTLAFAPKMEGKGQIYLHDVRPHILNECKKRLKRAGIQNAQLILADDPRLKKLKKKMDWVLVDVPCSGSGTLRRNPDMKWRFSLQTLERLIGQQRSIFEKALSFLAPGGTIVFGTCSLFQEENQQQVEHLIKTYDLALEHPFFQTLPEENGCDGFFGAVLKRKKI